MLIGPDGRQPERLSRKYEVQFRKWSERVPPTDLEALEERFKARRMESDYLRATSILSRDEPLFDSLRKATGGDVEEAAKFLGQLLWRHLYDLTDETWCFINSPSSQDGTEQPKEYFKPKVAAETS